MQIQMGCVVLALATSAAPAASAASGQAPSSGAQAVALPAPETILIRAQHVIVRPGEVLDDVRVLVHGGKIVAIGADLATPPDAREIEGRFVCAGFVDSWAALGLSPDSVGDANTNAATRALDALDLYNDDHLRIEALKAGVTTARLQAGAGARVGGLGALVRLLPGAEREDVVLMPDNNLWMTIGQRGGGGALVGGEDEGTQVVTEAGRVPDPFERIDSLDRLLASLQAGRNYLISKNEYKHELEDWNKKIAEKEAELEKDFKKAKKDREKEEKDAKEKGKEVKEKKYKEDKKPNPPRHDEDNEVVARVVEGQIPLIVLANRAAEIRGLLLGTRELDRLRLILAGGAEALTCAPELAERRIPVIVWPVPLGRARPDEYQDMDLALAARLSEAGVDVLLGSGGMDPRASRDLPLLAELAIGNGLERDAALSAVTLGAARALDAADRIGSVEVGKDADLLVLDGEPLFSSSRVRYVIAGGRLVVSPKN
jgi:imidazolonepropionase-like amidohydrolase